MTDPERLVTAGSSPLTQRMLNAAREEAPNEKLLKHTLLAAGIGASSGLAAGASGGAGGALGAKAAGGGLIAITVKWLGIGVLGGVATIGVATGVEHALAKRTEHRAVAPAAPTLHNPHIPRTARKPEVAEPVLSKARVPVRPEIIHAPPHSAPPEAKEASVAAAVRTIDAARAALGAGKFSKVLGIVRAYNATPGAHEFEQEALYLEMEALLRSGNPKAQSVARQLLALSPNGPYAEPARKILGLPE